jgi:hypothetical protein
MPRNKFDIDKIRASLVTVCPLCTAKLEMHEIHYVESERVRCTYRDGIFVPAKKKTKK